MSKPAVPLLAFFTLFLATAVPSRGMEPGTTLHFGFGSGPARPGITQVTPADAYPAGGVGYGFEGKPTLAVAPRGVASEQPFSFSVKLPEGNYNVTVILGDGQKEAAVTTVKAESRRLMVEAVPVAAGQFEARTFTVNVRDAQIKGGGEVKLNQRESGPPLMLRWDDKLTLEFAGTHPGVSEVQIAPAESALTLFIAGDSTVAEQGSEPYAGWGQMLSRFLLPGVAVSNHAESGLTLRSFKGQKRLAKIIAAMKPGDYLFIQFGHNDQKDKSEGAGPFTTYKQDLKEYVAAVRKVGGLPVLVTSMERRHWENGAPSATLAEYAEAVRQVGAEDKAPVIDLNAMSLKLYAALGEAGSTKAFVFYPAGAYPGQEKELKDNTHHNNYGGYELARCIVEGIRAQVPALDKFLVKDVPVFDPAHPDPVEKFAVPASSSHGVSEKPAGS